MVTVEHVKQYEKQGYTILEGVIPGERLNDLQSECLRFIKIMDKFLDSRRVDKFGITVRNNRYFIGNRFELSDILKDFLFEPLMQEIVYNILGNNAFLFSEQFVVKYPYNGLPLSWHQDAGYAEKSGYFQKPYMTCFCALDDMNEDNGTVYILPYGEVNPKKEILAHNHDKDTNDYVGYNGDKKGIPIIVPAGSIVVFSSTTMHRTGANLSKAKRRAYIAQYSIDPILNKESNEPQAYAIPIVCKGEYKNYFDY